MEYNNINYIDKIDRLQETYGMSTALAEAIGVSRRSLLNWRDKPESIKAIYRLNIDVLYCKHFLIPEWDKPKQVFNPVLLPDDMSNNQVGMMPLLRSLSFGTIEIETNITKEDFYRVIDSEKLPRNMTKVKFNEAFNTFVTLKWIWQKIIAHKEEFIFSEESIKSLHADFMRGVHEDAGFYSANIRVMGQLKGFDTTLSEDIPEEMNRWIYKSKTATTLEEIARAHAYFIAIHPFGDGNGRVGRALVMAQCLNARLMPPTLNGKNRAMYFAAMEHAMVNSRYTPLVRLFYEAANKGNKGDIRTDS